MSTTSGAGIERAAALLRDRRIAVLTGAGISTDSGIPAYRGVGVPPQRNPMTIDRFLGSEEARKRYWTGSHIGWSRFAAAQPNTGHLALAMMERSSQVTGVITQNVDGLHLRAGSTRVVEVHGTMRRVICLACGQVYDRRDLSRRIEEDNPWLAHPEDIVLNPDGDVTVDASAAFRIPACAVCGGMLKPDVVFFGELIPAERFRLAESLVRSSSALVVAGSSLVVNSGIRVIERARRRRLPLVIINHEPTRADRWAQLTLNGSTSEVLPALMEKLQ